MPALPTHGTSHHDFEPLATATTRRSRARRILAGRAFGFGLYSWCSRRPFEPGDQILPTWERGGTQEQVEAEEGTHRGRGCRGLRGTTPLVEEPKERQSIPDHPGEERPEKKKDVKQLVVVVPACWKFIEKVEKVRDKASKEEVCELLANWDLLSLLGYGGFDLEKDENEPNQTTKTYFGTIPQLGTMAEESLRMISQALERLTVNQTTSTWSRHIKTLTSSSRRQETRDQELKMWSDWKFSSSCAPTPSRSSTSMDHRQRNL